MARGLGEIQKNERMLTNYKIIGALYLQPYTYQQLWIATRIHRNTLRTRLDQLVKDSIIIKHRYKYGEKYYARHDFYLLNWANKQSREMVECAFGSKRMEGTVSFILDPSIFRTRTSSYGINSIHVKSSRKKYPLIGRKITTIRRPYNELVYDPYYYGGLPRDELLKNVKDLCTCERDIFERIRSLIETAKPNNSRVEAGRRDGLELIEKRDSILESLIVLCILHFGPRFKNYRYNSKFFFLDLINFSFLDLLIFFTTIGLYDYSRPYVKFWKIIEGSRLLIID